ncbi:MAG TPA: L,D-transpeptidase [Aestuariivirgaceae bacterium]
MNRRAFAGLTAAAVVCLVSRKAVASIGVSLPASTPATVGGVPDTPSTAPLSLDVRFAMSSADYAKVRSEYLPQLVRYQTGEQRGTIIVDTDNRFLYVVLGAGLAKRYGIAVGRDGFAWSGTATINRKTKWPAWYPPKEMQARDREAWRWRRGMPGGPRNPLGARALYLYKGKVDTLFRIHGTRDPKSIGKAASSGCIRMLNADIMELFDNAPLGTKVVVLPSARPVALKKDNTSKSRRARNRLAQARRLRERRRIAAYRRRRRRTLFGMFGLW